MSQMFINIYERSVAIVLGTVFLVLSGDYGNLFFDGKSFKVLYLCFLFIQKTAELVLEEIPQEWLVIESHRTPPWVMFLILC